MSRSIRSETTTQNNSFDRSGRGQIFIEGKKPLKRKRFQLDDFKGRIAQNLRKNEKHELKRHRLKRGEAMSWTVDFKSVEKHM